jgi:hypothetical protein
MVRRFVNGWDGEAWPLVDNDFRFVLAAARVQFPVTVSKR